MQSRIYTHSHFDANEFGDGGCKRTAQIHELLHKNGVLFNIADFKAFDPPSRSITAYVRGITYNKKITTNIGQDHHIGRYLQTFEKFAERQKPSSFIWESVVGHHLLLAKVLHAHKIPFIALPHNIESLVKGSRSFASGIASPNWFNEELRYLEYPDKVFTISREEQWLLSLYGIDADHLPYYPTDNVKTYLLNIRTEREKRKKESTAKKILLLGTFFNGPTLHGYNDLLTHLTKFKDLAINVAGFGSEALKGFNAPHIKIWGGVDNDTLKEILIDTDLVIINQAPTTGALTRIPELLIAGLPVIANAMASRSYYDLTGISTYHNFDELLDLVRAGSLTAPPIPLPPAQAEKRFINSIKLINKETDH